MSRERLQVAILTGQSDPPRCALSPLQQDFLDSLVPRSQQVARNFPYDAQTAAHRSTPLLQASIHNGWQYLRSKAPEFRRRHRHAVASLISQSEQTVFLAGSCGLELFNNLRFAEADLQRVRIFAYGPVARTRPGCRHTLVGSRSDFLSRWFFPMPDHYVDCSHLGYLTDARVVSLCRAFVSDLMP